MLILASKSPRRSELLAQIGVNFICKSSNIDETPQPGETAKELVARLAVAKAQSVYDELDNTNKDSYVLGSDTVVSIGKNILGKPENKQHCIDTLMLLSGKRHQVITAVALLNNVSVKTVVVESDVRFVDLEADEIEAYWNTGEPIDKAGSYAIQGIGAQFISHLNGSYSAVMGLPLFETAKLLKQAGLNCL